MSGDSRSKRAYDNSLRVQQQEMTHDSIMGGVQALILEGRLHNFTIQEVAEKAGVSYGTVYRHFPSREAILEGLIHWGLKHTLKIIPPYPTRLDDMPSWVEQTVPILMPYLKTAEATYAARSAIYNRQVPTTSRDRDELVSQLVHQYAPELPDNLKRAVTSALRMWISLRTWAELHVRYGLDQETLVLAVSESVKGQIERLDKHLAKERKG